MLRTYKSKKDVGGGVDRKDLLQNLDDKASAFDAFYIQNIKQTKRELSSVGASNPYGVNSNRVRKRKYVRRIVKEVEKTPRKSSTNSAYLTPDKSLRVNKPLDPFDMLLKSSPVCPSEDIGRQAESVSTKVDLFDELVTKKKSKTYVRKKPIKTKKYNYSSSMDDSDKENSDEQTNITKNSSDIKSHKLLVEQDNHQSPKQFDDSINQIVNNISVLNRVQQKYSINESMKRSFWYKNRLTNNQSPILQKSPFSSTPFKVKYRGGSIYKFSPILLNNEKKTKGVTRESTDSNSSIIFVPKTKVSPKTSEGNSKSVNSDTANNIIDANESKNIDQEECFVKTSEIEGKDMNKSDNILEISSFQTTEIEPFNGFPNEVIEELSRDINEAIERVNGGKIEQEDDKTEINKNSSKNVPEKGNENISINASKAVNCNTNHSLVEPPNITINDLDYHQHEDIEEKNKANDESVIRNNYSNILKDSNNYSALESSNTVKDQLGNEMTNVEIENVLNASEAKFSENCCTAEKEHDDSVSIDKNDDSSFEVSDTDNESLYNTCSSEESSDESKFALREPIVQIARMSDSTFLKYYEKMHKYQSNNSTENDDDDSEEFASFEHSTSFSKEESDTEGNLSENELDTSEALTSNEDNLDLSNNNEETEKCISFVTTRRRNDVTNSSIMTIFNDSYASSSTDCDKTVLSNSNLGKDNTNEDILEDNDIERFDSCEGRSNHPYNEIIGDIKDLVVPTKVSMDESGVSFITTRKSSYTTRKSSITLRQAPEIFMIDDESQSPKVIRNTCFETKQGIVLQPGKKWERSLSIYRRMTMITDHFDQSILEDESMDTKGRKYRQSVISTMELQDLQGSLHNESINSRRSTFVSKPSRSTIRLVKDPSNSRLSVSNTTVFDDLKGFLSEECDDTIVELSKLSIADQTHEVTVIDNFHDTSGRLATARDYVLRRCNQADAILFDECYPDTVLKNCHKIGEGVYGEVFLWRARDGRARVLKIVPIAGSIKVNGESQKDFHEIISEIVIAMELSALRAPIAEIERHFDEGKDVDALDLHAIENATDVFNEVLAVRCVYGSYPSRLLDLWDLYDECKGSENDNPAILPVDQQFIVLELANAGQDLESYQFNSAEQAHALFLQVAYGLAVGEEAFQFEHRDLHWGNVLIAPTDQKYATFVIRGRAHRVARCGVAATIIDYSLSRVSLPLASDSAALYNDLATDDGLFDAVGDYQFQVYRLMRDKLGNDWKNFEPYTNILWLHYTVDKMITALRYKRTNTKIHKHYIDKLKGIKGRILEYGSAALFVLTDNEF